MTSNIWFTADPHFDHKAILRHTDRQHHFADLDEMNDAFVDIYNHYVKPNDLLIIAGDVFWRRAGHFRQRLNVRNIWVTQGNHDSSSLRKHVSRMELMIFLKTAPKIHISHYPLASWRWREYGSIHLHGHCHGRLPVEERRIDVGMDAVFDRTGEYRPMHFDEVTS